MSSSGRSLFLAKITYRFSGLSKIKLLKYKMINFNQTLIVQRNLYAYRAYDRHSQGAFHLFKLIRKNVLSKMV